MKPSPATRLLCVTLLAAAFSSLALGPRSAHAVSLSTLLIASAAHLAVQAAPSVRKPG
jgi:hypothetical protein